MNQPQPRRRQTGFGCGGFVVLGLVWIGFMVGRHQQAEVDQVAIDSLKHEVEQGQKLEKLRQQQVTALMNVAGLVYQHQAKTPEELSIEHDGMVTSFGSNNRADGGLIMSDMEGSFGLMQMVIVKNKDGSTSLTPPEPYTMDPDHYPRVHLPPPSPQPPPP